jgi:hypothetical protein
MSIEFAFCRNRDGVTETKKADVAEHPKVFHHVGLLFNEPPGPSRVAPYLVIRKLRFKS